MQTFYERKLCIGIVFVGLILSLPASSQNFFSQIEDLPIAPGMEEVDPGSLFFQSSSGRIVVAVASGEEKISVIRRFYTKSLPPLGWNFIQKGIYRRNSETLKLRFHQASGKVSIYLHIVPIKNR
ncbi:MAG: hypothetical protein VYB39_00685 [Pseudomonadota bacterium]|nr:hypothetical protein [Pseudomonadota bacterium]